MPGLIPSRQTLPTTDSIFQFHNEAEARRREGAHVINGTMGSLMTESGQLSVMQTVHRLIAEVPAAEWAAYAPISGTKEFLAAVIEDVLGTVPELKSCAVSVATPGGTGAVRHAIVDYLEPGHALLVPDYYWTPYQTIAEEHGRTLETFSMFTANGELDVNAAGQKLKELCARQGRALIAINDPCNNPTGYSMTIHEWRRLVGVLLEHQRHAVTLLVDMAYWLYRSSGDPREFLAELKPLLGKVGLLFAWSASKSFTHYGLRVGALIACEPDPRERVQTEAAFSFGSRGTWSTGVRGGQWIVRRVLSEPKLRAACDAERDEFRALLGKRVSAFNAAARGRVRYPRYDGGFFVTAFHEQPEQAAAVLRTMGIFLVPVRGGLRAAICSIPMPDIERLADGFAKVQAMKFAVS